MTIDEIAATLRKLAYTFKGSTTVSANRRSILRRCAQELSANSEIIKQAIGGTKNDRAEQERAS